jgi:hypothetical protein
MTYKYWDLTLWWCDIIWIELNHIWVRALPGPLHLGLKTGPLCPMFYNKLMEPCFFSKVPNGLCTLFPNILWVQKEGTQMCMSEWSQGLTLTQNVDWGFLLRTTFPTNGVILNPITYKCLLKVLCPARRPITTLDCVVLKDNNRALVARSGPEINSWACLCVLMWHHIPEELNFELHCCCKNLQLLQLLYLASMK